MNDKKLIILFQGDSVTDTGRNRKDIHDLGLGYPKFAAELIQNAYKQTSFEFINLGVSCEKLNDLYNRMQKDIIDIKPDIVSILIGINDIWSNADDGIWTPNDIFEDNYRTILYEIKNKTNAKIILLEPFLLYTPDKEKFYDDMYPKILIIRKLAREFADEYIPLDGLFTQASINCSPTLFAHDGVHPTERGAKFIAEKYFEAIQNILK